jgi:hypothetical protein
VPPREEGGWTGWDPTELDTFCHELIRCLVQAGGASLWCRPPSGLWGPLLLPQVHWTVVETEDGVASLAFFFFF